MLQSANSGDDGVGQPRHEVAPRRAAPRRPRRTGRAPAPVATCGPERVQVELERRDDAEAAAAAAHRPEQVGVLVAARGAHRPVGGDDLDRAQVVAGSGRSARCRTTHAAAEGEPGDRRSRRPRRRASPARTAGWPGRRRPSVRRPGPDGARDRVDVHGRHRRQVDHQAVVADRAPGDLVPAAADAHRWPVRAGHPRRRRRRRRCSRSGRSRRGAGRSARSTPGGPRRSGGSARSMTSPCHGAPARAHSVRPVAP